MLFSERILVLDPNRSPIAQDPVVATTEANLDEMTPFQRHLLLAQQQVRRPRCVTPVEKEESGSN